MTVLHSSACVPQRIGSCVVCKADAFPLLCQFWQKYATHEVGWVHLPVCLSFLFVRRHTVAKSARSAAEPGLLKSSACRLSAMRMILLTQPSKPPPRVQATLTKPRQAALQQPPRLSTLRLSLTQEEAAPVGQAMGTQHLGEESLLQLICPSLGL